MEGGEGQSLSRSRSSSSSFDPITGLWRIDFTLSYYLPCKTASHGSTTMQQPRCPMTSWHPQQRSRAAKRESMLPRNSMRAIS